MNNRFITIAFALLITAAWGVAALADETTANEPAKVTGESSSSGKTSDKQVQDSTSSSTKTTKADEVKLEADKRTKVESRSRRGRYRAGYYGPGGVLGAVEPGLSFGSGFGYQNAGVIFSPGGGGRKPAMGIQWLNPKGVGMSFWASGDLGGPSDLIDATIPHSDFYLDSTSATYAIEAVFALSRRNPTITLGAGVASTKVWNYAVSNATGWKWNEGTETSEKFAGQIGCRFRVSDRVSFQYTYDTVQHNFYGLTVAF